LGGWHDFESGVNVNGVDEMDETQRKEAVSYEEEDACHMRRRMHDETQRRQAESPYYNTAAAGACELSSSPPLSITSAGDSSLSPRPNAGLSSQTMRIANHDKTTYKDTYKDASCTHQWYPSAATPTREQESGFKHASSSEAQNTAPVGGGAASAHRHLSIALDKLSSSKSATAAHMSPPLEPAVSYRDRNKILKSPLYSDFTW
jgi:hypothetical protein